MVRKLAPLRLRRCRAGSLLLSLLLWLALSTPLAAAPVTALIFSPDGAALLSGGDRGIDVRSPKDASIQRRIDCDIPKINALAFAPRGPLLIAGGGVPGAQGDTLILSWPEGKVIGRLGGHTDLVTGVAFDPDRGRLVTASADSLVRVWGITPAGVATNLLTLHGHAGPVLAVAFSPGGDNVISAGADRSLKVWSIADGTLLRTFSQHTEAVHVLAFRPRPRATDAGDPPVVCATAGDDRTVRVWQPLIGRMVRIIRRHEGPVFALAWHPDGSAVYSAGQEGMIRRLDAESDEVQSVWRAHDDWIYALAISPDGTILASGDWAGQVRLHDPRHADASKAGRTPGR